MSLYVEVVGLVDLLDLRVEEEVVDLFNIVQDIRLVLVIIQLVWEQEREEQ